jgi:hypothetical protein
VQSACSFPDQRIAAADAKVSEYHAIVAESPASRGLLRGVLSVHCSQSGGAAVRSGIRQKGDIEYAKPI